jgi:hypothetical protein
MMAEHAIGREELDVAQLAAQIEQKTKRGVNVIAGVRQAGADDENPAVDRRRDEKFLLADNSLDPGAGLRIIQRQGGLNRVQVAAANRQPRGGPMLKDQVRRNKVRKQLQTGAGCGLIPKGEPPSQMQRQQNNRRAAPQHNTEQDEKQNRDQIPLVHSMRIYASAPVVQPEIELAGVIHRTVEQKKSAERLFLRSADLIWIYF